MRLVDVAKERNFYVITITIIDELDLKEWITDEQNNYIMILNKWAYIDHLLPVVDRQYFRSVVRVVPLGTRSDTEATNPDFVPRNWLQLRPQKRYLVSSEKLLHIKWKLEILESGAMNRWVQLRAWQWRAGAQGRRSARRSAHTPQPERHPLSVKDSNLKICTIIATRTNGILMGTTDCSQWFGGATWGTFILLYRRKFARPDMEDNALQVEM